MVKIQILSIGKNKELWLEEALKIYLKRLTPFASIAFCLLKETKDFEKEFLKAKNVICLDPLGPMLTSEEFTKFIFTQCHKTSAHLTFAIGGAEGFPKELIAPYPKISFSKLTFTHQMIRLLLVEQIYRAFEIQKNSGYHK